MAQKEVLEPVDTTFMASVIQAVGDAPDGVAVAVGGAPKECSGCSECADD